MKFFRALFVVIMAVSPTMISAADVAMVVSGAASAELGKEKWAVEIAEMLPENVVLTVGTEDILKLIHLASDIEYEIPAGARAKITGESIEGSDLTGRPLSIADGKIFVAADMGEQAGTANPDRHLFETTDGAMKAVPAPSRPIIETPQAPPDEKKKREQQISGFPVSNETSDSSGPSGLTDDFVHLPTLHFALPQTCVNDLSKDERGIFAVEPATQIETIGSEHNWVVFSCRVPENIETEFSPVFTLASEAFRVNLIISDKAEQTMGMALSLEKQGYPAMAAAMWFELAKKYQLSDKVVKSHLDRLQRKLHVGRE